MFGRWKGREAGRSARDAEVFHTASHSATPLRLLSIEAQGLPVQMDLVGCSCGLFRGLLGLL